MPSSAWTIPTAIPRCWSAPTNSSLASTPSSPAGVACTSARSDHARAAVHYASSTSAAVARTWRARSCAGRNGTVCEWTSSVSTPIAARLRAAPGALMPGLTLRAAHSSELVAAGERFDLVISNHLLHHLTPSELSALLPARHCGAALPGGLALHRDIERGRLAYLGFALATAAVPSTHLRHSFICAVRPDEHPSLLHARRAACAPAGWTVRTAIPARLELRLECQ